RRTWPARLPRRSNGPRHRRARIARLGAVATAVRARAGAARAARPGRRPALPHRTGARAAAPPRPRDRVASPARPRRAAHASGRRYVAVRFGNVLGSSGSVVPLFQRQLREGVPLTVTDPAMTRFFMTIPEASRLILEASLLGAPGDLFVLDMGEPVRIVD